MHPLKLYIKSVSPIGGWVSVSVEYPLIFLQNGWQLLPVKPPFGRETPHPATAIADTPSENFKKLFYFHKVIDELRISLCVSYKLIIIKNKCIGKNNIEMRQI